MLKSAKRNVTDLIVSLIWSVLEDRSWSGFVEFLLFYLQPYELPQVEIDYIKAGALHSYRHTIYPEGDDCFQSKSRMNALQRGRIRRRRRRERVESADSDI